MADIGSKGVVLPLGAALAALAQALTLTQAVLAKAEGAVEDTAKAIAAAAEAAMILAMMLAMIAMQWLTIVRLAMVMMILACIVLKLDQRRSKNSSFGRSRSLQRLVKMQ